jgi:hypothetical protein
MDNEALQQMIDEGVIVTKVPPETLAEIQRITAPLLEKYCPPELLKAIRAK